MLKEGLALFGVDLHNGNGNLFGGAFRHGFELVYTDRYIMPELEMRRIAGPERNNPERAVSVLRCSQKWAHRCG